MRRNAGQKPAEVPFQRCFAIVGYAGFCCVLMVALAEGVSRIAWSLYSDRRSPLRRAGSDSASLIRHRRGLTNGRPWLLGDAWDAASASPAYDGYPWAEEFWREERARRAFEQDAILPYEPFRLWSWRRWNSQYINMDETEMGILRRTLNSVRPDCDRRTAKQIWFFGGSAAWGYGTPDFATIPSYLSAKLNAQSAGCFEIVNLGMIAYVIDQEGIYLSQELGAGRKPDLAIFYDGINDAYVGAFSPAIPGTHDSYRGIKGKFESRFLNWPDILYRSYFLRLLTGLRRRLASDKEENLSVQQWAARAQATFDHYESTLRMIQAISRAYGFEARFFWQPVLFYGNKAKTPFERAVSENQPEENAVRVVYEEAERRLAASGKSISLVHIFDGVQQTIYADWSHPGPRGNEMVAEAIAAAIRPSLQTAGAAKARSSNGERIPPQ
jgi:lysophospholipase L1-like esterase